MPLRFRGAELRPVLAEAIRERCQIVLQRGDGVYWHAACSSPHFRGYLTPIAYALGCNPRVNAFEHWWGRSCDTLGTDTLCRAFDPRDAVFACILHGNFDLELSAEPSPLSVRPVPAGTLFHH